MTQTFRRLSSFFGFVIIILGGLGNLAVAFGATIRPRRVYGVTLFHRAFALSSCMAFLSLRWCAPAGLLGRPIKAR